MFQLENILIRKTGMHVKIGVKLRAEKIDERQSKTDTFLDSFWNQNDDIETSRKNISFYVSQLKKKNSGVPIRPPTATLRIIEVKM